MGREVRGRPTCPCPPPAAVLRTAGLATHLGSKRESQLCWQRCGWVSSKLWAWESCPQYSSVYGGAGRREMPPTPNPLPSCIRWGSWPYHLLHSGEPSRSSPGKHSRDDPADRGAGELVLRAWEWDSRPQPSHPLCGGDSKGKMLSANCPCHLWWRELTLPATTLGTLDPAPSLEGT